MSDLIEKGVTTIFPSKELLTEVLSSERKLNVYLGIDPTATRIHLGHAVALRKLQTFVELGHNVTFLIGDFTALIGDTSDKDSERPVLTTEEINQNFASYKEQASKIVDFSKVAVRHNSEWLSTLTFTDIIKLCQNFSVGDFVGRELIKKRLQEGKKVGLHETLYPVMQGYDSYFLDTDIQIGGSDQTFNMLAGRTLQKNLRSKESFVLCVDYLPGTDGRKMSKSWGNAIWLTDEPNDMYGKIMSISDSVMETYFKLATSLPDTEYDRSNPLASKKKLAWQIVSDLHSKEAADSAQSRFEETFQHATPSYDTEIEIAPGSFLIDAVAKVSGSNSEAKRLVSGNAVDLNGHAAVDGKIQIKDGDRLKVGKKIFVTIRIR